MRSTLRAPLAQLIVCLHECLLPRRPVPSNLIRQHRRDSQTSRKPLTLLLDPVPWRQDDTKEVLVELQDRDLPLAYKYRPAKAPGMTVG